MAIPPVSTISCWASAAARSDASLAGPQARYTDQQARYRLTTKRALLTTDVYLGLEFILHPVATTIPLECEKNMNKPFLSIEHHGYVYEGHMFLFSIV